MRRSWAAFLLFLIILAVAWQTGRDLLFHLAYLILAVIVFSFLWAWFNVNWVVVERQTRSQRTQVGKVAEERFIVHNTGILPKLWIEVRDDSDLPGHRVSRVVRSLPPRRRRGWVVRTLCRRRGKFTLGPITLTSGDPFGLFKRRRYLASTSTMIVYPATVDLPDFELLMSQSPGGEAMRRRTHHITSSVAGVREYFPGDSFNRIHWPSTARMGRLIVKEFELDPMADVWLFLDMERRVQAGSTPETAVEEGEEPFLLRPAKPCFQIDPTTEEYAVTIAASIAKQLLAQSRAVGLITYGQRREFIQADRGERQLTKLLETLAVIRATSQIPLDQMIAAEGSQLGRNVTAIVITPSTDKTWVGALRHLRRWGVRVVVVLLEASTFGEVASSLEVVGALAADRIPIYLVKRGEALDLALSHKTSSFFSAARYFAPQTWDAGQR